MSPNDHEPLDDDQASETHWSGSGIGGPSSCEAANLQILNGPPFEPATEVDAVMLDGKFVFGEVDL